MARKRLLMLLKPFDVYPSHGSSSVQAVSSNRRKVLKYLHDRTLAHKNAINLLQCILEKKAIDWKAIFRSDLPEPIRDVDLVISVGGDGTLLQASHLMDDQIPILGVNSDPTRLEEVAEQSEEFDATRSTGYLCAATVNNFEPMLDEILERRIEPSKLARMAITINSKPISPLALNDILLAHPCPATVSRFSFRIKKNGVPLSSLHHSRSSGIRVSTAAGSTAAIHSAGGSTMPILSNDLQYMVREPIFPWTNEDSVRGFLKPNESLDISWFCREGLLYIDGSHVVRSVQLGDTMELSTRGPPLKVYLPTHLLSQCK